MPGSNGYADGNALVMGDVCLSAEGVFFPGTRGVRVEYVEALGTLVQLSSTCSSRACPDCGVTSRRVHSRYGRQLDDRPVAGRPVLVRLTVRRFFCDTPTCGRRTFVEQVDSVSEPYQRASSGLRVVLRSAAAELGARPGVGVLAHLQSGVRGQLQRCVRSFLAGSRASALVASVAHAQSGDRRSPN